MSTLKQPHEIVELIIVLGGAGVFISMVIAFEL